MAYELWDAESGNIIGSFESLNDLVQMAAGMGQANADNKSLVDDLIAVGMPTRFIGFLVGHFLSAKLFTEPVLAQNYARVLAKAWLESEQRKDTT